MKKIILLIIERIRKALKVDEKGNSFGWRKGTLLLAVLMMVGCDYNSNENINTETEGGIYGTIIIDSCEYIRGDRKLSHKGNCCFCEERDSIKWEKLKKELEELVIKLKEK